MRLLSLPLIVATVLSGAQRPSTATEQALQTALDRARQASGAPGAAASIVLDGAVVWEGGSGRVSRASSRSVDPNTLFVLASLSKPVTAALVMHLRTQGRLTLDDPLSKYAPGLPNASRITIRMLLNHTSGLGDYDSAEIDRKLEDPRHQWTRDQILGEIDAGSQPGRRYSYSNSGYIALGAVIERAGGTTVGALFRRVLAGPLGLRRCSYQRDPALMPSIATGHDDRGRSLFPRDGFVPTGTWGDVWTDGGLACSAGDTARLLDAIVTGRVTTTATAAEMYPSGAAEYGLGIDSNDHWIGHSGSYGGFESEGWHDRQRRLTIVALANREDGDAASRVWEAIVRVWR